MINVLEIYLLFLILPILMVMLQNMDFILSFIIMQLLFFTIFRNETKIDLFVSFFSSSFKKLVSIFHTI